MSRNGLFDQYCLFPCLNGPVGEDPQNVQVVGGISFTDNQHDDGSPLLRLQHTGIPGCEGGLQQFAVVGTTLNPVCREGKQLGWWFETEHARVAWIWGLTGDRSTSREQQAMAMFTQADTSLQQAGMRWTDVVRTWIYLDHLLDWYDTFNNIRTEYYEKVGVLNGLVPASTGIGIANCDDTACSMGLLAVQPRGDDLAIHRVESPLQNSALTYRSSFSRAIEIKSSSCHQLMISGTASIDPQGYSVHCGYPERQIELTMQVVRAILMSRQMDWSHNSRSIVYFKKPEYTALFKRYCEREDISLKHCLYVHADICRDDLLFELELDAVKSLY